MINPPGPGAGHQPMLVPQGNYNEAIATLELHDIYAISFILF